MAHDLSFTNGVANCAWNGETPWHGLGTKIADGENENEARVASTQFGSGAAMKDKGVAFLMALPQMKDRVLLAA